MYAKDIGDHHILSFRKKRIYIYTGGAKDNRETVEIIDRK